MQITEKKRGLALDSLDAPVRVRTNRKTTFRWWFVKTRTMAPKKTSWLQF